MQTRHFALIFGIIYTVVGVLSFIPGLLIIPAEPPALAVNSLYGHDIWLHAATAVIVAYFGFIAPVPATVAANRVD